MADGTLGPEAFSGLMARMRPQLHRYCARMVGSAIDGEDVVQEALAKASQALAGAGPIERPESWLFRIAHNAALDALRRRRRHAAMRAEVEMENLADPASAADRRVAAAASLAAFMRLSPRERSSVVLIDVLGHALTETVEILGLTLPAVKAALHRGRAQLKALADAPGEAPPILAKDELAQLRAYADRFNARDFDALRDLLAQDVRLDLANRTRLNGRADVSVYFSRYAAFSDWRLQVGLAEGRPALLVSDDATGAITHAVLLDWKDGEIAAIRDYKFAPYVMETLAVAKL